MGFAHLTVTFSAFTLIVTFSKGTRNMRLASLAVLLTTLPILSAAQEPNTLTSSEGEVFVVNCNDDGYVLTYAPQGDAIYLGRSCDVYSPELGKGQWCASNGGMLVDIGQVPIGFPRQAPYCPGEGYRVDACPCEG
jgi:hypothetical protein